jgi:hypothetical protein
MLSRLSADARRHVQERVLLGVQSRHGIALIDQSRRKFTASALRVERHWYFDTCLIPDVQSQAQKVDDFDDLALEAPIL